MVRKYLFNSCPDGSLTLSGADEGLRFSELVCCSLRANFQIASLNTPKPFAAQTRAGRTKKYLEKTMQENEIPERIKKGLNLLNYFTPWKESMKEDGESC